MPEPRPEKTGWRKWLKHLPHLIGLALMVAAIGVVQHELRHLRLADIKQAMIAIPGHQLWLGVGCTFLSYFILSFYDRLAVIQVGYKQISFRRTRLRRSVPMCCPIISGFRRFPGRLCGIGCIATGASARSPLPRLLPSVPRPICWGPPC
nr:YbhN family protein [Acetobacter persici]